MDLPALARFRGRSIPMNLTWLGSRAAGNIEPVNRNPRCRFPQTRSLLALAAALALRPALSHGGAHNAIEVARHPAVAIENVSIVDVVRGRIVGPRTVLIVDGRIAAIDKLGKVARSSAALRVDGRGQFLMPALVDMHVHLFNNASHRPPNDWAFPLFIANGVTAVREMAAIPADLPVIARWRAAAARGELIAPHVLSIGVPVRTGEADAVRRQVREAHASGADFSKVFSDVGESTWRVALQEARALRLPVCGHIPADVSLLDAAAAGQRTNEHLTQIFEACTATESQWLALRQGLDGAKAAQIANAQEREILESFDSGVCERTAAALARTGQVQVPTLVLAHFEARSGRTEYRDDPRWRYLRPDEQARWALIIDHELPAEKELAARRREVSRKIVKALHLARVPILAGTDAPMPRVYPGFSLHKELELLVEAGLSPADALRAATFGPAEFLGLRKTRGSIAVGKRADLLLLEGNPLREISQTQRIRAVVLDGRLLQRADLDALLAGAARSSSVPATPSSPPGDGKGK